MWVRDGGALYREACRRGYTLPAFNIASSEMAQAWPWAEETQMAPAIRKTHREEATVPILHLDHGEGWMEACGALRAGYGSAVRDTQGQGEGAVEAVRAHVPPVHLLGLPWGSGTHPGGLREALGMRAVRVAMGQARDRTRRSLPGWGRDHRRVPYLQLEVEERVAKVYLQRTQAEGRV